MPTEKIKIEEYSGRDTDFKKNIPKYEFLAYDLEDISHSRIDPIKALENTHRVISQFSELFEFIKDYYGIEVIKSSKALQLLQPAFEIEKRITKWIDKIIKKKEEDVVNKGDAVEGYLLEQVIKDFNLKGIFEALNKKIFSVNEYIKYSKNGERNKAYTPYGSNTEHLRNFQDKIIPTLEKIALNFYQNTFKDRDSTGVLFEMGDTMFFDDNMITLILETKRGISNTLSPGKKEHSVKSYFSDKTWASDTDRRNIKKILQEDPMITSNLNKEKDVDILINKLAYLVILKSILLYVKSEIEEKGDSIGKTLGDFFYVNKKMDQIIKRINKLTHKVSPAQENILRNLPINLHLEKIIGASKQK